MFTGFSALVLTMLGSGMVGFASALLLVAILGWHRKKPNNRNCPKCDNK